MSRTLVRRSCGHLEAVYAVGAGVGRLHEKEKEICGVCRKRFRVSDSSGLAGVQAVEDDRKAGAQDLRGEVRDILNERKQSNTNKGDSA